MLRRRAAPSRSTRGLNGRRAPRTIPRPSRLASLAPQGEGVGALIEHQSAMVRDRGYLSFTRHLKSPHAEEARSAVSKHERFERQEGATNNPPPFEARFARSSG